MQGDTDKVNKENIVEDVNAFESETFEMKAQAKYRCIFLKKQTDL